MDATTAYAFHSEEYFGNLTGVAVIKSLALVATLLWATRRGERADIAVSSGAWGNVFLLWLFQAVSSLPPFLYYSIAWLLSEK